MRFDRWIQRQGSLSFPGLLAVSFQYAEMPVLVIAAACRDPDVGMKIAQRKVARGKEKARGLPGSSYA